MIYNVLVYTFVITLKKNKGQAWCGQWESNPQNTGFEPAAYANSAIRIFRQGYHQGEKKDKMFDIFIKVFRMEILP
jgi:hypothetical protein